MMHLRTTCLNILAQLTGVVEQIKSDDFSKPSSSLSNSTIGQHLRHTIEFFFCFMKGCERGVINYDEREHDKLIETDKVLALHAINNISAFICELNRDIALTLEVRHEMSEEEIVRMATNVSRELVYNIEHAVHHMALMKIGIREIAPYVALPHNFGIAASTIRYHSSLDRLSR